MPNVPLPGDDPLGSAHWRAKVFMEATDPILIEDLDGVVIDMNAETERCYGISREDLIGKPIKTLVPPERHGQADDLLRRCRDGEDIRNVEALRQTEDGTIVPVLVTLSALRDEDGTVVAIATIAKDITEQRTAEAESRRMAKVFRDAADPILIEDLSGIVVDMNDEAERSYGFTRSKLIGKPIKLLVPTERHAQADELLRRCRAGEDVRNVEGLRWTRDGQIVPVLLTLSALKDATGSIIAISTLAKDITERKAAEEESRKLAKVFQDAAVPILIEDLEGVVVDLNAEAERSYGFARDELIGRPIKTLVPPNRHIQADELLARCLSGEEVRNMEGLRWTKDKRVMHVLLTVSALKDETGQIVGIATIAKDISQQKAAEDALEQERQNLETRVAERTQELTRARTDLQELAEKLSRYLSPQVYKSLFEGTRDARIETRRRWLTVFFSDLVGFTPISEKLDPEELTSVLNEYLIEMTEIVFKYGGTLDKYIGDAILVFFGDPDSRGREKDAYACVAMALEMQERLKSLREQWAARGSKHPFHARMGITSGHCTVGNFGSARQMSYTIIGRQVNLASRLEGAAPTDGILVAKPTWSLVNERVNCVSAEAVIAKGFAEPVDVYKVVGHQDPKKTAGVIRKSSPGFSLWLDPETVETDRDAVIKYLRRALRSVEDS